MGKLNVGVIGGGAIGLLFAAQLSGAARVKLFVRRAEQQVCIMRHKLYLEADKHVEKKAIGVTLSTDTESLAAMDLIIVAVKSYQLDSIMDLLQNLNQNIPLLFLQNGVNHIDWAKNLPQKNILIGVVTHGVLREKDNYILARGFGATYYGVIKGILQLKIQTFLAGLAHFQFILQANIEGKISEKWLLNAVINPLTAVLYARNGELIQNPYFKVILEELTEEVNRVLLVDDALKKVIALCEQTAKNFSSMALDFHEGRKTEIDSILYPVIIRAHEMKKCIPRLEMLYHIIKGTKGGV